MTKAGTPRISVIMPAYNCAATAGHAINSILNQSLSDLELIIVYDNSPDGTLEILQEHASHDSRIHLVENRLPPGAWRKMVSALNLGMTNARAPFLARMDTDDIAMPDRLATQIEFLTRHPDVDICGTWAKVIDKHGVETGALIPPSGNDRIRIAAYYAAPLLHPTYVMRRKMFEALDGYRDMVAEDYDLLLRAIDAGFKLDNCPIWGISYRQQPSHRAFVGTHKSGDYALMMHKRRRRGLPDNFDATDARQLLQNPSRVERYATRLLEKGFDRMQRHRLAGAITVAAALLLLPGSRHLAVRKLITKVRLAVHG